MKVTVDRERCTGHGRCFSLAPSVYESDDDGYGYAPTGDLPADLTADAEFGRDSCPEQAIDITG